MSHATTASEVTPTATAPEPGQLVEVRRRQWIVADIDATVLSPEQPRQHLVKLASIDEDALGEEIEVLWELEPGAHVIERAGLPTLSALDDPWRLEAFLDAVRWGAATSADRSYLQAPFRSGVSQQERNMMDSHYKQDIFEILKSYGCPVDSDDIKKGVALLGLAYTGAKARIGDVQKVVDEQARKLEDLHADLAGCEVLIEDLEAGLLDRDERLEALRAKIQALEAQNKKLSVELRCDVSTAPAVEQIAEALANENERLKEALAHTTEDFKKFRNEVSGESMRAYQAGKREAIESRRVKTIVRRAALSALSKAQAWVEVLR